MAGKNYVQPPKKNFTANKDYVQPPKKGFTVDKNYVQPPKKGEIYRNSFNNENVYEDPNTNQQSLEDQDRVESFFKSIRNHLTPEYREEYNIRRFFGCLIVFLILFCLSGSIFSLGGLFALVWTFFAWIFWHYSFWNYHCGFLYNFINHFVYFGSFFSLLLKILIQNFFILLWVTFTAPIVGFLIWRKAVRHGRPLTIDNARTRIWRD
ncbi:MULTISPECIES: hypothetical protein [Aerococcus]|uniref:hypothetical protein n=1 Tax=Aerococcus TaxID=1375 RepID=UPI000DCD9E95|nr:hypothetical protein [Aerococcus urinae]RAV70272.1 hypothetical protein DBT40_08225 [Aerococcus urinae]RAW04484.1 hypothetical protein DBT41_08335 [Aerococcus urinae]